MCSYIDSQAGSGWQLDILTYAGMRSDHVVADKVTCGVWRFMAAFCDRSMSQLSAAAVVSNPMDYGARTLRAIAVS
jgi:hypothetical protein